MPGQGQIERTHTPARATAPHTRETQICVSTGGRIFWQIYTGISDNYLTYFPQYRAGHIFDWHRVEHAICVSRTIKIGRVLTLMHGMHYQVVLTRHSNIDHAT